MSKPIPKISVIIPMYDIEDYLGFWSRSAMRQTFEDFELKIMMGEK